MVSAFRQKLGVLFFINALLLPAAVLTRDLLASGASMLLFVLVQAIVMLTFLMAEDARHYEWHAFWLTATGTVYMLVILMSGRSLELEILGFFLFLAYIISGVMFLIPTGEKKKAEASTFESGLSEEELNEFRDRDELKELLETVDLPEAPKQRHLTEFEDFRKERKAQQELNWEDARRVELLEEDENKGYYEIKAEPEYEEEYSNEGYIELYPEERKQAAKGKAQPMQKKQVLVTELKEAPKVDMEHLRQSMQELGKGVKTLDDRVKLIAEKAILEGAEKKLKKMIQDEKKKKEKKEESWIYSSVTGNKYHYKRSCMSLRRVKKKDLVLFEDSAEARRKGLKACGLCKK